MRTLAVLSLYVYLAQAEALTLSQALDQAAAQNPNVQMARLRVLEARALAAARQSEYLPQVNVSVSTAYQTNNLQGIGLAFPGLSSRLGPYRTINARLSYPRRLSTSACSAPSAPAFSARRLRRRMSKLSAKIPKPPSSEPIFRCSKPNPALQPPRPGSADALLAQTTDLEQAGRASKLDLARQQQRREIEQLSVIAAQQETDALLPQIAELIGRATSPGLEIAPPTPAPFTGSAASVVAAAQATRPDLAALKTRVAVAEQELARVHRERLPKVTGLGDYGLLGAGPDRSIGTWNIGTAVTIPLWTSGRLENEANAAGQRVAQAKLEIERLQLAVQRQPSQAWIDYQASLAATTTATRSVFSAQKILELAQLRYQSGLATTIDTVTAQANVAEADDALIRARYLALMAQARLAAASGDVRSFLPR